MSPSLHHLAAGDRVYHLGAGTGYYSAIMAEVVGPSGSVVASEIHSELGALAQQNLADRANVTVYAGDGMEFDPGEGDAILINAGVSHPLPLWLDRLRPGGRMLLPITTPMTSASAPPPSSNKRPLASSAECPIGCRGRLVSSLPFSITAVLFISIVERRKTVIFSARVSMS